MRVRQIGATLMIVVGGTVAAGSTLRELPAKPTSARPLMRLEASRALHGRVLHESTALALPSGVEVVGDRLLVADDFADRSLKLLSRKDGALLRAFGRKGRGPREFESVLAMDVIDPRGRVMVYDPMLQRVTWIDLDRDFRNGRWVADRSVTLAAPAMLLVAAWEPDGLIGLGSFTEGRLAHLSLDGRLLRTTGSPPVDPAQVSPEAWTRAYQSRLKARPDRARWAVASRFADRLDIYDSEGVLVASADRPYGFGPTDPRDDEPEAVRFGYVDVATTGARIYALFSGRTRAEGQANLGDRIHVFDWNGRLLEVWQLDARLIALAVTPQGDRLYGIRHEPTPSVVVYSLD